MIFAKVKHGHKKQQTELNEAFWLDIIIFIIIVLVPAVILNFIYIKLDNELGKYPLSD